MKWILGLMFIPLCLRGELKTVESVDLDRYMGIWYEIARFPNQFQRKCIKGGIAHYSLRDNGMVEVVNQCETAKGTSYAKGVAWVVNPNSNAKLKVSFFPFAKYFKWFAGDYWIIYLDKDYQNAIVGDPSYKYLWFLSRSKSISNDMYQNLKQIASTKGFPVEKLKRVGHD